MNGISVQRPATGSVDPALAELVERLTAQFQAGAAVDEEAVLAEHPEQAGRLRELLPALRLVAGLSQPGRSGPAGPPSRSADALRGTLGDFRLLREVGRGGMGVVYEAEQISLGRRVALKVLPFAATMDPRHLQRFHNEALAAAHLDHPHIVDVYGVGCERGVHFYAMRFVEGHTLAEVIDQLRDLRGQEGASLPDAVAAVQTRAEQRLPRPDERTGASTPEPAAPPAAAAETAVGVQTGRSSGPSRLSRSYFRSVAELGAQLAEALDHAHQMGVVHRDIKPSNLMLDGRGKVWITDFGLAHLDSAASLTVTGDLVGTLRYMSPEQALAKRVTIDHRSDIYSLGVTLYELLTLKPAYDGKDRQELLRQIAFEEPRPPRRLCREVPAEVETVILKAMEKNPQDRYATAQELADDLRCWLEDRPIRARRPSWRQVAVRWARRHRPLVTALALTLVLALLTLGVGNFLIWRATQQAEERVGQANRDAQDANRDAQEALRRTEIYRREVNVGVGSHASQVNEAIKDATDLRFTALGRTDRLADAVLGQLPGGAAEPTPAQQTQLEHVAGLYEALLAGLAAPSLGAGSGGRPVPEGHLAGHFLSAKHSGPGLFWSRVRLGIVYARSRQFARATAAFRDVEAVGNWMTPHDKSPFELEEPPQVREAYRKALAYWARHSPDSRDKIYDYRLGVAALLERRRWASYYIPLLNVHLISSEKVARRILGLCEQVFVDLPTEAHWSTFAEGSTSWGLWLERNGRTQEANQVYLRALHLFAERALDAPGARVSASAGVPLLGLRGEQAPDVEQVFRKIWARYARKIMDRPADASELVDLARFIQRDQQYQGEAKELALKAWALFKRDRPAAQVAAWTIAASLRGLGGFGWPGPGPRVTVADYSLALWLANLPIPAPRDKAAHLFLLGEVLANTGCLKEAEGAFREALALRRRQLKNHPGASDPLTQLADTLAPFFGSSTGRDGASEPLNQLADTLHNLGCVLLRAGRPKEAEASFREALALWRGWLRRNTDDLGRLKSITWQLAVHPDPRLRNPTEAATLAQRLDDLLRRMKVLGGGEYWNTVGVARYRAGDWKGALEALGRTDWRTEWKRWKEDSWGRRYGLGRSEVLAGAGGWFFRAMAHWRLGHKDAARKEYAEAVRWMDENAPEDNELKRFRVEAAALLGIPYPPAPIEGAPEGK